MAILVILMPMSQPKKKVWGAGKKVQRVVVRKRKKQRMPPARKTAPELELKLPRGKEREARLARILARGKERGFVTYDEILKEFPTIEDDIAFLDALYERLQEG